MEFNIVIHSSPVILTNETIQSVSVAQFTCNWKELRKKKEEKSIPSNVSNKYFPETNTIILRTWVLKCQNL